MPLTVDRHRRDCPTPQRTDGLTQARFAALIDVQLSTLRNWEQGRREPTGPAKALLKAIHNDPVHVLNALSQ
ncbi:helix-turn-helix domain-containing protein [Pseudomonas fluorescens]